MKKILIALSCFLFSIWNVMPVMAFADGVFKKGVFYRGGVDAVAGDFIPPDPPPDLPIKIMFVGDSITQGATLSGQDDCGFRDHFQDLERAGLDQDPDYVGPIIDICDAPGYDPDHNGVSGNDTLDILARIDANLATYFPKPNNPNSTVFLGIGTNDIKDGFSQTATVNNVRTIINKVKNWDPNLRMFVSTIIPSTNPTFEIKYTNYNTALTAMLITEMGLNSKLHRIDQNTNYRTCNGGTWQSCMYDTIHPKDTPPSGYQVMANALYSCYANQTNTYCDGH